VCLAAALASLVVPALTLVGPAEALAPAGIGPKNPQKGGFPAFFTDDAGRAVQLCLNGRLTCAGARMRALTPPEGEAFYWSATAALRAPGINVDVEWALEAAFAGRRPMVFDRLRIRGHVSEAGTYTINHPYGTTTVRAITPDEQRNIDFTSDVGCAPGPLGRCTFASATNGRITTFLRQVGAPRGFYGNPNVFKPVTGGEQQSVSISGPSGGDTTDRFAVMGRVARGHALAVRPRVRFGNVGGVRTKRVRVVNVGTETTRVRGVRLPGERTLSEVRTADRCRHGVVLRSGQSCWVGIRYRPDGRRVSSARLLVKDNFGKVTRARVQARTR
jgi:hypothetical protein